MSYRDLVAKTKAYSAYFLFPLTPVEIHYWLITDHQIPFRLIKTNLQGLSDKEQKTRLKLARNTLEKEKLASEFVKIARFFPGIKLIALTGSVAIGNTQKTDDLDLLIITAPNSLWLLRPLILFLLNFKFHRRHPGDNPHHVKNSFCPNLWLDESSLSIPRRKRNLYTAHEVLQIKPLYDSGGVYGHFLLANRWTKRYLANAYFDLISKAGKDRNTPPINFLLIPFNFLLFSLQYLYMLPKKTTEFVDLHSAFFHKNDLSRTITRHLQNNCL
jgi:hypothetical protein